jgi:hypothetical protein
LIGHGGTSLVSPHPFPTFWRKIVGICLSHFSKNVPVV